jgi:ATP-dependent exoDNAse (exonuclease V) alpha subunit
VARRNDYPHGLVNGARGIVTAVDADREEVTVRFGHRQVRVPAAYLRDGGLDHGYALTVHQAQGLTCARALLLGSDALYREAGYVGLSRGRQRNDLHLVDRAARDEPTREDCHPPRRLDADDALDAVRAALARSRAQSLARDLGR